MPAPAGPANAGRGEPSSAVEQRPPTGTVEQVPRRGTPEGRRVGAHRTRLLVDAVAEHHPAVERGEQRVEAEPAVGQEHRVRPGRQVAVAAQLREEAALGVDAAPARRVLDGRRGAPR